MLSWGAENARWNQYVLTTFHVLKNSTALHEITKKNRVMWNSTFKSKVFFHCICILPFLNIWIVEIRQKSIVYFPKKIKRELETEYWSEIQLDGFYFFQKIYVLLKVRSLLSQLVLHRVEEKSIKNINT